MNNTSGVLSASIDEEFYFILGFAQKEEVLGMTAREYLYQGSQERNSWYTAQLQRTFH